MTRDAAVTTRSAVPRFSRFMLISAKSSSYLAFTSLAVTIKTEQSHSDNKPTLMTSLNDSDLTTLAHCQHL